MKTTARVARVAGAALVIAAASVLLRAQTPAPVPVPAALPSDAFFDDRQLQSISLTINSRDWQTLRDHYLDNAYYPCDFKWNNQTVRNVGIRSRGTGSRNPTKPGLRVDFDRYTGGQTFLGLKSFILRNQTQDGSNMHERIAMQLFARLGVKAPREAFARLYVNNAYWGLYTIVESVDKTFLRNSFGEDQGHLYKYDYNVDDLPWYFEDRGLEPSAYVPHPFKPETHEDDPVPERIVELVRIVNNDSDAVWRTTIAPYIDWENFLRHIAIENVVADQDGFNGEYGVNNFYWYRLVNQRTFVWIPWDKSEAFKNGATQTIFHNFLDGVPSKRNRLSLRAMTSPDLQAKYLDLLIEAARSLNEVDPTDPLETRGWMEREIDREHALIRESVYADPQKPFTNEQFEAEVEALRDFARNRAAFVLDAVAAFRKTR